MNPIQHPQTPKINHKPLMMQIMHPGHTPQKPKPAMHRRRHHQLIPQKHPEGAYMATQDLWWEGDGEHVGKDLLDWMGVLSGEGDRGCESVVLFVETGVEGWMVEEAVGVVEEGFAEEEAEGEVGEEGGEGGEGGGDAVRLVVEEVDLEEVEEGGEELVAGDDEEAVQDRLAGGLFGGGLDLVALGEGWEEDVEKEVAERGNPEGEDLDGEGAHELNGLRRVGFDDVGPELAHLLLTSLTGGI
ncbi:fatty acid hydroxylase superfamily-domain-containing protein [Aspergillus affinis]|uniref:fatty acid hydroxylase superfamily-domain-containing protein n=1 Tax=Aspergillus affinis TaxID=1070780 RepID=UPI0022FE0577|nr:fatty acid hydroxylase superfamily-domain-containing protein [Aspergillus affinis]KAI9037817.1 fatty acid hydroxylase superfamily-domain-containing protein [Aspergillus affinis]